MAKYRLTNKAVEDLADIWNNTFDEWSERQADDYYNMLISSCQKIATNPHLFGKRYDEIFDGLRGFKAGKHLLFYRMLDSGEVEVIRILHERMDLRNRMNE
ncbi:type II toxin-antitoxin system RelE/ParE family toxin [Odoribacter lunatus]|uniref:type II toxin-antitoxin system RelE/ParE family toxin n=1 Tax=Odoribacter lunatus TaxID=2941335 RepID=UPI00203DB531|nr:type II toxin-antitoxin system RelE/ParE family toxin [Odoribacter lunatus]